MRVFESRKVEAKRRVGWPVQGECHLECGAATRSGGEPASNFVMNVMREGHVCHRALVPASHGVHWILEVGGGRWEAGGGRVPHRGYGGQTTLVVWSFC